MRRKDILLEQLFWGWVSPGQEYCGIFPGKAPIGGDAGNPMSTECGNLPIQSAGGVGEARPIRMTKLLTQPVALPAR